jgi:hypothetical protein
MKKRPKTTTPPSSRITSWPLARSCTDCRHVEASVDDAASQIGPLSGRTFPEASEVGGERRERDRQRFSGRQVGNVHPRCRTASLGMEET